MEKVAATFQLFQKERERSKEGSGEGLVRLLSWFLTQRVETFDPWWNEVIRVVVGFFCGLEAGGITVKWIIRGLGFSTVEQAC